MAEMRKGKGSDQTAKLSLADLSNIAQVVSAVAVFASLIYLGYQISLTNKAIEASTVQSVLAQTSNTYFENATNEGLAPALARSADGVDLSTEDRLRIEMMWMGVFSNYENQFYQYQAGNLPEPIHNAYGVRIARQLNTIAGGFWDENKMLFSQPFRSYVNKLPREP